MANLHARPAYLSFSTLRQTGIVIDSNGNITISSSSSSSSSSSAYETFLERVAIHRSRCVALSSVPPLPREDSRGEEDDDDDAHDAAFSNNAASCTSKALATSSSVAAATKNVSFEAVEMPSRYVSKKHAIFGSLWGDTMIEEYQVYRPVSDNDDGDNVLVLAADVTFGTHVNGHGGIVHGGILGLMFDDAMGWAANEVLAKTKTPPASSERPKMPKIPVTANLSVDFRKPVYEGASVRMEVVLERREGRKLYFGARMLGASDGELYAEATSLYIVLK